ncbi:HEAT repeat domain-containing protein [Haloarchaeobius sp. FL176]|uniref:HEAT repeat domain-containing protein n=1 Tax=Haloarchaeobius sp. FL176 TaxID=2967129 RepID=UPI002147B612|nr:HEAT repeat domain-containing protein [Haloarchaeobius sp. FL176]
MTEVTLFGYVVPMRVILVRVGLVVGVATTVSFCLTMGLSVYRSGKNTRRERVRPDLREELLNRLFADEPDWEGWVDGLSRMERAVVESLLDDNLRELDGREADRLRDLGDALGIPERAGRRLESRNEYDRLQALTWLTLLCRPDQYVDSTFEPQSPRERAAVVTLLQVSGTLPDAESGISMLLDGTNEEFTVFGQDTLYRVARDDPEPLLRRANRSYSEWPEPLLTQVLAVCANLGTSVRDGDLGWLTAALETENEAIRAAAAAALGSFGWNASLRDQLFLERATDDPSPRVRAAVYEMLAAWGDEKALWILLFALVEETHPRALTLGTAALVRRRDRIETDGDAVLGDAWAWSLEHAEYDQLARTPNRDGVTG